jgi:hypothetical protein
MHRLRPDRRQKAIKLSTGDGALAASLDVGGATALSVTLLDASGQATATGRAVLDLVANVPARTMQIVVAGDGTKTSFRLKVTYATP